VSMQTWKRWEQGRMNINQPALVTLNKTGCKYAHEARQQHIMGLILVDDFGQGGVELLPAVENAVWHHMGGQPPPSRPVQARSIGSVRYDSTHLCGEAFPHNGVDNGLHIGAATGDQYNEAASVVLEIHHDNS